MSGDVPLISICGSIMQVPLRGYNKINGNIFIKRNHNNRNMNEAMIFKKILDGMAKFQPFKEGTATKVGDGISDVVVGSTVIMNEVLVSPFRIVGRTIDGAVSNRTGGILPIMFGIVSGTAFGFRTVHRRLESGIEQLEAGIDSLFEIFQNGFSRSGMEKAETIEDEERLDYEIID